MHPLLRAALPAHLLLALAACATAPGPAAGPTTGDRSGTVVASGAPEAGSKDDPMVCVTEQLTGSRVHARRVCKPASTWAREEQMAKELGIQMQNQGSLNPLRE